MSTPINRGMSGLPILATESGRWHGHRGPTRNARIAANGTTLLTVSPLPLLVAGIGADHEHDAAAPDDLALLAHAANAGANLHGHSWTPTATLQGNRGIQGSPRL
jgi:hypothetical protein